MKSKILIVSLLLIATGAVGQGATRAPALHDSFITDTYYIPGACEDMDLCDADVECDGTTLCAEVCEDYTKVNCILVLPVPASPQDCDGVGAVDFVCVDAEARAERIAAEDCGIELEELDEIYCYHGVAQSRHFNRIPGQAIMGYHHSQFAYALWVPGEGYELATYDQVNPCNDYSLYFSSCIYEAEQDFVMLEIYSGVLRCVQVISNDEDTDLGPTYSRATIGYKELEEDAWANCP